jgi:hypothetical protein
MMTKMNPLVISTIKKFLLQERSTPHRTSDDSSLYWFTDEFCSHRRQREYYVHPVGLLFTTRKTWYNQKKPLGDFFSYIDWDIQLLGNSTKCERCEALLSEKWNPCKCQAILCDNCDECYDCEHAWDDYDRCHGCGDDCGSYMCKPCRRSNY